MHCLPGERMPGVVEFSPVSTVCVLMFQTSWLTSVADLRDPPPFFGCIKVPALFRKVEKEEWGIPVKVMDLSRDSLYRLSRDKYNAVKGYFGGTR